MPPISAQSIASVLLSSSSSSSSISQPASSSLLPPPIHTIHNNVQLAKRSDINFSKEPALFTLSIVAFLILSGLIIWKCRGMASKDQEQRQEQKQEFEQVIAQNSIVPNSEESRQGSLALGDEFPMAEFSYIDNQDSKQNPKTFNPILENNNSDVASTTAATQSSQRKESSKIPIRFQITRP